MMRTSCVWVAAGMLAGVVRAGVPDAAQMWFSEDFSGYSETSSTKWTTAAGTWTKGGTADRSVYSNDVHAVVFDTHETELTFSPKAGKSAANALVRIDCTMAFTACRDIEDWTYANASSQQAALGIRLCEDGKNLTFFGWRGRGKRKALDNSLADGVWIDLSAPGIVAEEGVAYRVTVETDQSCQPTRIRYSVNGTPLADVTGETWLTANCALEPWKASNAKTAKTVSFYGRGSVSSLSASVASTASQRAKVTFARPTRPAVGTNVTFTVAAEEGKALGTKLTYSWAREDASGLRTATGLGTGATHAIGPDDFGHWIVVDVSDEYGYAGSGRFWCSELPVAYLDVDPDSNGNVWPQKKGLDYTGRLTIVGNATYADQYDGALTLHVRGNSTSGQDKKPYKIKLDKKTDVFGLGGGVKSKHWVLMANMFDESLMRNKVAMDLSGEFGIAHMKSEWVDVVMNGQFVGNYLFCQQIRVSEERVNVYNWSDAAEKIAEKALEANPALTEADQSAIEDVLELDCGWMSNGRFVYLGTNYTVKAKGTAGVGEDGVTVVWKKFTTDISGGYLFELDLKKMGGQESPAACWFVQTNKTDKGSLLFNLAMNTPEYAFTSADVRSFVWEKWWNLGQSWLSGTGYDGAGHHAYDISDFTSMVGYWLTMYVMSNDDSAAFSRYAYLDQGGKMTYGPGWDFDCGLGSLSIRVRSAATTNAAGRVFYAPIKPEQWIPSRGNQNYFGYWTADPYFSFKVREKYLAVRPYLADLVSEGGRIDRYIEMLKTSAKANDIRWNNRIGFLGSEDEKGDALVLKEFISRRLVWLDAQFATVGKMVVNATETVGASALRYVRNAKLRISFADATPMPDTVETDMTDATLPLLSGGSLAATVAMPSGVTAASVRVSVNGRAKADWLVDAGVASGKIAAGDLVFGARNMLAFDALDASGKVVARNVALVSPTPQGMMLILQ